MKSEIEGLLERLGQIEEELEKKIAEESAKFQYRFEEKKVVFENGLIAQHRKFKTGLFQFLRESPLTSFFTAPVIYSLIFPLSLLDLSFSIYQRICFPVWGIVRVKRSEFIILDRQYLNYLNAIEKMNCLYCGYANGVIAYVREIASRTEQNWCPIKHARRIKTPHKRYRDFLDYGDAEGFRKKLEEYREKSRSKE